MKKIQIVLALAFTASILPTLKVAATDSSQEQIQTIQARLFGGEEVSGLERALYASSLIVELQSLPTMLKGSVEELQKMQKTAAIANKQLAAVENLKHIKIGLGSLLENLIGKLAIKKDAQGKVLYPISYDFVGGLMYKLTFVIPSEKKAIRVALQTAMQDYTKRLIKPHLDTLDTLITLLTPPQPPAATPGQPAAPTPPPAIQVPQDAEF